MRRSEKRTNQRSRQPSVEQLERRNLLAVIQGTVRNDVQGDQQIDTAETGVPGIVVYLDLDNDGARAPNEPQTVTAFDNPATAEDEAGRYQFDMPAGIYTVRQDLPRNSQPQPNDPAYIQTAPLRNAQLANPMSSPYGQWNDQFNPNRYVFEWNASIAGVNNAALPSEWHAAQPGGFVAFSMSYDYNPSAAPQQIGQQQMLRYSAIESYSVRFDLGNDSAGTAEVAHVDPSATLIDIEPNNRTVLFSVPLQTGNGLRLEASGILLPNVNPFVMPRASEIEFQQFRIVEANNPNQAAVLNGQIDAQQFRAERPARFGHVAQLPQNQNVPFDFWISRDDDQDGLPNAWEEEGGGIDINADGIIDLDLFSRGADPKHKDVFVEVDAMTGRVPSIEIVDLSDIPGVEQTGTALDRVVRAFANAPVENPDGVGGIRLHLELDNTEIPLHPFSNEETPWAEFDAIKAANVGGADARIDSPNRDNAVAARSLVYRYALFADTRASGSTGLAELPGNDFFVALGDRPRSFGNGEVFGGGSTEDQAGTFMHELGHTLGLRHGGDDDINYKPNYLSVMNYHWQVPNSNIGWTLDYSGQELPELDPNSLDETSGIGAPHIHERREVFVGPVPYQRVPVSEPIDWNRDHDATDHDVAAEIYRTTFRDIDGVARPYDVHTHGKPEFDSAIHGHDDWSFQAEDMMLWDDPEFSDGVHACDDPESPDGACFDDITDFFSLSVSPDLFEVPEGEESIDISIIDFDDWFVINPGDDTWEGGFSIHNEFDQDSFLWSGANRGIFRAAITHIPGELFEPEIYVLDAAGNRIGTTSDTRDGKAVVVDLETIDDPDELTIVVKNVGADDKTSPGLGVDPAGSYRYLLSVYGPRSIDLGGTKWDGSNSESGIAGDGTSWSDANNWAVNGVPDQTPDATTHHTFATSIDAVTIALAQDREVRSLQFRDTFVICEAICPHSLSVTDGTIDVFPNATATINASLTTESGAPLRKRNQGKLVINGDANAIDVVDGTLGGSFTTSGPLQVGRNGRFAPDATGTLIIGGQIILDGTYAIDVAEPQVVTAEQLRLGPTSRLHLVATAPLPSAGQTTNRVLIDSPIELEAITDRETFAIVVPNDHSSARVDNHLGFGVFIKDILYHSDSSEAILYQAHAGDSNGNGIFDSMDLIVALEGGVYEKDQPATWVHGDWNGDNRFDSSDLVVALQLGNYVAESTPRWQTSAVAASIHDELAERDQLHRKPER